MSFKAAVAVALHRFCPWAEWLQAKLDGANQTLESNHK